MSVENQRLSPLSVVGEIRRKYGPQRELKERDFVIPSLEGVGIAITGTTSGIGHETARLLAKSRAHLFLISRDYSKLNSVVDEQALSRVMKQFTQFKQIWLMKMK